MIYTVTLNPSIDYIVRLDQVQVGSVNRMDSDDKFAGGKGINVSRVLKRLGIPNTATGFIGGFTGEFITDTLAEEEIETRFVQVAEDTRINVKIKADQETEINGTGPNVEPAQLEELKALYHKMIDWGADIIFGGHPHVVEPSETVEKDGEKKLIIYSMGNFISNQRIESMGDEENAKWTERGVLMDVTIKKKDGKTTIGTAKAHPTWVNRTPKGTFSPEGYPLYHYQTYILEDFIEGGSHRDQLDEATKERIDTAYKEMNEHVGLKWD